MTISFMHLFTFDFTWFSYFIYLDGAPEPLDQRAFFENLAKPSRVFRNVDSESVFFRFLISLILQSILLNAQWS